MKKIYLIIAAIVCMAGMCGCSSSDDVNFFGSLYGTVTDAETGNPIDNATISLAPGGKTTISGSDGSFEYIDLEEGQYTITVQKEGYTTNRKTTSVVAAKDVKVDIPLSKKN